jgi:hypothetical protein
MLSRPDVFADVFVSDTGLLLLGNTLLQEGADNSEDTVGAGSGAGAAMPSMATTLLSTTQTDPTTAAAGGHGHDDPGDEIMGIGRVSPPFEDFVGQLLREVLCLSRVRVVNLAASLATIDAALVAAAAVATPRDDSGDLPSTWQKKGRGRAAAIGAMLADRQSGGDYDDADAAVLAAEEAQMAAEALEICVTVQAGSRVVLSLTGHACSVLTLAPPPAASASHGASDIDASTSKSSSLSKSKATAAPLLPTMIQVVAAQANVAGLAGTSSLGDGLPESSSGSEDAATLATQVCHMS